MTVIDEEKCEAPDVAGEESLPDNESEQKPMSWEGKYQAKDYMTVFHLITNSNKRSFGDLFKRCITALYICQCLKLGGFFGKEEPQEEDVLFVAALALRHLQGASCNAYEISEYDTTAHTINEVGGAFYTTVSLTNHSCKSNAIRYSVGDKCVLRAIRFIPKGSEVFDNYGFQYYSNPVVERQEVLLNQYKFKCLCEACTHNWPLYPHHQMETLILRCPAPKCQQSFCYSTSIRSKCNLCGNVQEYTKLVKEVDAQLTFHKDCLGAIKKGNTSAALAGLLCHQIFLDHHVVEPVKHYTDVVELIRNCYSQLGNVYNPHEATPIVEAPKAQGQKLKAKKNKYVSQR